MPAAAISRITGAPDTTSKPGRVRTTLGLTG